MIRVGILGATGYTALELIKILLRHPEVELAVLTSRQEGNPHVAAVHPQLAGRLNMQLEDLTPPQVAARCDCVFSCLPHGASATAVAPLLEAHRRVIDFSADYRLSDPDVYAEWYGQKHADPQHLPEAVYGLPELFGERIPETRLIANPGCYPTSAILALAPFLHGDWIDPGSIVVDAKSGVSGAGRTPKLMTHYPECNESVVAYNVGRHRHTPEIDQVLSTVARQAVQVLFTPHLIPMDRGILSTVYAQPLREVREDTLLATLREFYAGKPFVRVVEHLPATKDVYGSNFCDITVRLVRGRVVVFCCIDNLVKGASGAAVQNFNLMYGFPETMAF
ncbi:MAG: N-acetyl-gamma-glutamyl-phosphate reductase [Pirellulaceae bacterium]|jgi:N-acetyl-gamma-glutamyl-phosphate reductase|nr:N-acetyl-gamma-glutamyl-phosphate reductase [Pirellulaceae bacterium]